MRFKRLKNGQAKLKGYGMKTLLRNLFLLACDYAAQELAYRKIQGQFNDVKSVVTIAGYQRMLEQTYLILGLQNEIDFVLRKGDKILGIEVKINVVVGGSIDGRV